MYSEPLLLDRMVEAAVSADRPRGPQRIKEN